MLVLALYLLAGIIIFTSAYLDARMKAHGSDTRWIDKSGPIIISLFVNVMIFWPFLLAWIMYDEIKAARNSSDIIGGDDDE